MCSLRGCYNVATPHMAIPCMAILHVVIPRMAYGELHEMCMFHATRKCGPHKHMMGILRFLVGPHVDTQVKMKLYVTERYHNYWYNYCTQMHAIID